MLVNFKNNQGGSMLVDMPQVPHVGENVFITFNSDEYDAWPYSDDAPSPYWEVTEVQWCVVDATHMGVIVVLKNEEE